MSKCVDGVCCYFFFFFNDTATTEIYTLSLHDALPISTPLVKRRQQTLKPWGSPDIMSRWSLRRVGPGGSTDETAMARSEEHTSELQSRQYLVCRLLLEKKKKKQDYKHTHLILNSARYT